MTTIVLGPFFDEPLHRASWQRPAGSDDYRVTAHHTSPDLINKGEIHQAVDVGDLQGKPAPFLAPITGRVRGLAHWDGARGVEIELEHNASIKAWHLSSTPPVTAAAGRSAVGAWMNAKKGQRIGWTGNSGKQPMPFHTHLELWIDGRRVDIEPHLFGAPIILEEDDMQLPADAGYFAEGKVGPGNRLRIDHATSVGSEVTTEVIGVQLVGIVTNGTPYELTDGRKGDRWYVVRRGDTGDVRQVAHLLVTGITPTATLFSQIPLPAADCSPQNNKLAGGRTAIAGALQAHEAAGRALGVAAAAIAP